MLPADANWLLMGLAFLPVAIWLGILLHPAQPADCLPVDGEAVPDPEAWPAVQVLVPARNEAPSLPATLPALLAQEYPGRLSVLLIDDRSDDGTADAAREAGRRSGRPERLRVMEGGPLPEGWTGKVWALEQGRLATRENEARWLLQTDADILHAPDSLRRLVAEAEGRALALDSRMARLHCRRPWEKLLIPPFVWFFNLLYPMRWVNDPHRRSAAAAGGCVLLRRDALDELGGYAFMRSAVIDDVTLAQAVKARGHSIRLAWSDSLVVSGRPYEGLGDIRRMIRRTAFTELRHSAWRLAACLLGLLLTFAAAPLALLTGLLLGEPLATAGGGLAWLLMALAYRSAPRFYGLGPHWWLSLPVAGLFYGAFTFESALLHWRGQREAWRSTGGRTTERA